MLFRSNFLNQRKSYEHRLVEIVKTGISKNEFKNINPFVTVFTMLSAVRGLELWHRHKKTVDMAELEENMINHLMTGIIK